MVLPQGEGGKIPSQKLPGNLLLQYVHKLCPTRHITPTSQDHSSPTPSPYTISVVKGLVSSNSLFFGYCTVTHNDIKMLQSFSQQKYYTESLSEGENLGLQSGLLARPPSPMTSRGHSDLSITRKYSHGMIKTFITPPCHPLPLQ